MTRSEVLLGRVRDLGRGGDGVVETDRGIVFVPGVLPGERVRLTLSRKKKRGALRGQLLEVVEAAPERVESRCDLVARCGGCPLMILDDDAQRAHKAGVASWATGIETPFEGPGAAWGYRRRARMAFAGGRLGYRHQGRSSLLDVEACSVLEAPLGAALRIARRDLLPYLAGAGELLIARGRSAPVLWIRSEDMQPSAVYTALEALVAKGELAGAVLAVGGAAAASFGEPREWSEAQNGEDGEDDDGLWGAPFGFSQANSAVNAALVARVVDWAAPRGARVIELYAGHGNLSVALAKSAASLVCIEQSAAAAAQCRENLSIRGLDAKVIEADAAEGARRQRQADLVVLDPPRTGARTALPAIVDLAPDRIVYVSCDPPTLRRDLGILRESGYSPRQAAAFDMFPHTAHLEIVVHLSRQ